MIRARRPTLGPFAPVPVAGGKINRGRMTGSDILHAAGERTGNMRHVLSGGGHCLQPVVGLRSPWQRDDIRPDDRLCDRLCNRPDDRAEVISSRHDRPNDNNVDAGPQAFGLHAALTRGAFEISRLVPQSAGAFDLVRVDTARRITRIEAHAHTHAQGTS